MILAIDIGNTTTSFGLFRGATLRAKFSVPTPQLNTLVKRRARQLRQASQIIVCSVVPRMTAVLLRSLRSIGAGSIRVVGRDVRVPLVNRYTYPKQVGQDRLVGAYAAWCLYNKRNCIVADFGTAITIDVVTKKGEYLGGVIAPGLDISLEALATRTALLPKITLKEPPELLGRDTANSMRAGLIYGAAALCDGLVAQLKAKYAPGAAVVATGGASRRIATHARSITHLKPHLVLEGLVKLSQIK
jgi:type III pantothenate kinase